MELVTTYWLLTTTPAETLLQVTCGSRFEAHCNVVRSMALAVACDYRRVSTGIPYLQTLGDFLVERAG